jgi:hypothetical protein
MCYNKREVANQNILNMKRRMTMTKAIKATAGKKEDAKATLRKTVATAAMTGLANLDGAIVAPLSETLSEILVRTAEHDVVITVTVKKERLAVEFEVDEVEVPVRTSHPADAECQMIQD